MEEIGSFEPSQVSWIPRLGKTFNDFTRKMEKYFFFSKEMKYSWKNEIYLKKHYHKNSSHLQPIWLVSKPWRTHTAFSSGKFSNYSLRQCPDYISFDRVPISLVSRYWKMLVHVWKERSLLWICCLFLLYIYRNSYWDQCSWLVNNYLPIQWNYNVEHWF